MSAIFPKWTNRLPAMILVGLLMAGREDSIKISKRSGCFMIRKPQTDFDRRAGRHREPIMCGDFGASLLGAYRVASAVDHILVKAVFERAFRVRSAIQPANVRFVVAMTPPNER